jgi:hypothetical protein
MITKKSIPRKSKSITVAATYGDGQGPYVDGDGDGGDDDDIDIDGNDECGRLSSSSSRKEMVYVSILIEGVRPGPGFTTLSSLSPSLTMSSTFRTSFVNFPA